MNERKYYLDILRIIAITGVLLMHVSGHCIGEDVRSMNWQVCNIFDSGTRWAVPLFVMISGSLFLDSNKKISINKIYTKYILRLIIAYIFWSFIYTLCFSTLRYYNLFSFDGIWNTIVGTLKGGMYHFWFIFMIIGLYVMTPVLKELVNNSSEKVMKYWMVIMFVFAFCIPVLELINPFNEIFGGNIGSLNLGLLGGGYIFYYVLGHYLNDKWLSKKQRIVCYVLGIAGFIFTLVHTGIASYVKGEETVYFRDNLTPNVLFMSVAIFIFVKQKFRDVQLKEKNKKVIFVLSKYSFGIYLVHELILSNIDGLNITVFSPVLTIIVLFTITSVLSFLVTYVIDKTRFLRNYII